MNGGVPDAVIKSITKKDIDDFYKMARKFKPEGGYGATAAGGRRSEYKLVPYGITKSIPNYAKLTTDNKVRAINTYYENLVTQQVVYGGRNWKNPTVEQSRNYYKAKIWYDFLKKFGAVNPMDNMSRVQFLARDVGWSEFRDLTEGEVETADFPQPVERLSEPVQPVSGSVAEILKGREGGRVKKPPRVRKKPFEKLEQAYPSQEVVKKQITIKPKKKPTKKIVKLTEEEKAINQKLQDLGLSKARAAIVREAKKRGVSIAQILDERKKASEMASKAWALASSSM